MQTRMEWLKWRQGGLGSSDYAAIMGVSRYKTIAQVYDDKVAEEIKEETSWIMERGNRIEPRVRALYELQCGESFSPAQCEMENFPFMRVSLDGRSVCLKNGIEIKLSGKDDWQSAKLGKVPETYWPQVQGQMLVANLDVLFFLSYLYEKQEPKVLDPDKLAVVTVLPDRAYQGKLLEACSKFWHENVLKRKPPIAVDSDYKPLVGLSEEAKVYKTTCEQIKQLELIRDDAKELILSAADKTGEQRLLCAGLKISKQSRAGSINYKSIPELKNVDFDQYRGKGSSFWKIEHE